MNLNSYNEKLREQISELVLENELLKSLLDRLLGSNDTSEDKTYPFWFIGVNNYGRGVKILSGIWFSKEDAENHLKSKEKTHTYPIDASVICWSSYQSISGLCGLMRDARLALDQSEFSKWKTKK
jgi:hypothetical protein